jgi:hypothetical protein
MRSALEEIASMPDDLAGNRAKKCLELVVELEKKASHDSGKNKKALE